MSKEEKLFRERIKQLEENVIMTNKACFMLKNQGKEEGINSNPNANDNINDSTRESSKNE
jgi:hypothetical protein